jgi:thioredoxin
MAVVACQGCGARNRVDERAVARLQPVCGKCGTPLPQSTGESSGKPKEVTDDTFPRDVLNVRDVPVLLDCWAEWCGPCRMLTPVLNELAAESNGRYVIAKLNVDDNPRTASQFNIRSIPTMLIFKNGAVVDKLVGAQPKQAIAARLQSAER